MDVQRQNMPLSGGNNLNTEAPLRVSKGEREAKNDPILLM